MKLLRNISLLLIAFFFCSSTGVVAQRKRGTAQKPPSASSPVAQPTPTFENLLAADTYRLYVEIRGIGQLLKNQSVTDVMDPVLKVASPPKEFRRLISWLHSESDAIATSRVMIASWPARPKIPNGLLAIEFASPEEAQKFEPRLKAFLPKMFPTPQPTSSPEASPSADLAAEKKPATAQEPESRAPQAQEVRPSFFIKQSGSLVFVSDSDFTFKNLRPAGSKLHTEDPNFRRVYDRFASEPLLVYLNSGALEREEEERRREREEENLKRNENAVTDSFAKVEAEPPEDTPPEPLPPPSTFDPDAAPQRELEMRQQMSVPIEKAAPPPTPDIGTLLISRLGNVLFSGRSKWPEGIGLGVAFEPDHYSVRLLLVNEPDVKGNAIPFVPQFVSGPALTPEAAAVFPADAEFFVTFSLDYPQIYESMAKVFTDKSSRRGLKPAGLEPSEVTPFTAFEAKSGINLRNDLIPLLSNELALMLPLKSLDLGPPNVKTPAVVEPDAGEGAAKPAETQEANLVIAVGVRDQEGMRNLLPKLIDSLGFKGAHLIARSEKRGDTELVSYADAASYAFVGNFLLISPSSKELRRVVDAYLNHETLAGDIQFRNSTRWQPRQVLGQFYLSSKLMDRYRDFARTMDSSGMDQFADLLSRATPTSEPLTYALSNEGSGPLHELRMPKNLAMLMLASMFGVSNKQPSADVNESVAQGMLRAVAGAEATFRATKGSGGYGSLEQLVESGLIAKDALERHGYRIELTATETGFEARAVPQEYGKTGKLSFFIDESNVLRAGDHGGGPATVADKPVP